MSSPAHFILARLVANRRRSLADRLALVLGLSAGAVGTSSWAHADDVDALPTPHTLLLPEHYELMDNGVVVFKLETGENLSLTADQYLIMADGLLLITDELAQASVYSLPVMGSIRAQLLSDLAPIATIDGTVAEATPSQTLAITQGTAPRLSEQVDLQSYELAQASDGSSSEVGEAVAVGLSVSPGAMALLGMLMTSDQPEAEAEPTPYTGPARGFVINGIDADDNSGFSVSSAGDINNDGFDDIIIGAYGADPNGSRSGESYVVFGKAAGYSASLELSSLNGTVRCQIIWAS
ncbi:MAG: FG-GAP repeat protein [Alphaproteobacteria bacterium]|nr:FG-GAP repeat protein [Alphaproteobacteria bacterium]